MKISSVVLVKGSRQEMQRVTGQGKVKCTNQAPWGRENVVLIILGLGPQSIKLLLGFLHLIQDVLSSRASCFKCYQAGFLPEHFSTCVVFVHLGCSAVSL